MRTVLSHPPANTYCPSAENDVHMTGPSSAVCARSIAVGASIIGELLSSYTLTLLSHEPAASMFEPGENESDETPSLGGLCTTWSPLGFCGESAGAGCPHAAIPRLLERE